MVVPKLLLDAKLYEAIIFLFLLRLSYQIIELYCRSSTLFPSKPNPRVSYPCAYPKSALLPR